MSARALMSLARSGPACCLLMKEALDASKDSERGAGIRRRVILVDDAPRIATHYKPPGRGAYMLVVHCPFCGARQDAEPSAHDDAAVLRGVRASAEALESAAADSIHGDDSRTALRWGAGLLRSAADPSLWEGRQPILVRADRIVRRS